ncbi:uncharacterized protein MAL13P1.304 isoform X2 [Hydra vulgaris]|uniref:Uncharacterized protein MAL13P1.304 isoform X2 n=1 Tax=Hydra vulgaris TaxID=6087 RepID=A0ABM4CNS9_HYDVU
MWKKQSKTGQKDNQPLNNHNSEIVHVEEKKYPSISILSAAAVAVIFITLGAAIHYTTASLTNFNLEYSELQLQGAETADKRNKENKNFTQIEKNKTETTRLQTNERSKTRARERREIVLKKHQNYISLDKIVKKLKKLTKIRNRRHLPKHLLHRYLSLIQQIEEQNRHHINLTLAAKNFVESVVKHIDSYKKNSTKRNIEEDIEETTDEVYPKVINDETEKPLDHTSTPSYSYDMNNEIKADITALTKVENKVEVETGITNFTMVTEPNNDGNGSEKQSWNETSNQNKNNNKPVSEQHKNDSFEIIKTNNTHHVYVNQIKSNQTYKQHSKDRVNTNTSFIYHFHNFFLDSTQSNKKSIHSLTNNQTNFYEISVTRLTSLNDATKSFQSEVTSREFLINNQLLLNTKNKSQITDVYETKYSLQTSKIILQASEIHLKNSEFSQNSSESLPASKISLQDSKMNLQANEMHSKTSKINPQASKISMHVSEIHFQVSEINLQASEITSQISLINLQASEILTLEVSESVQINQNHNVPAKSSLPEINLSNKSKYEAHSIITNMNALKSFHFKNEAKKVDLKPSYSSHFSRHSFENSFKQEDMLKINVHSNNTLVMKSSILGEILPTKSFTTKTQLDYPTIEDNNYGINMMTTSINITSSFTKHLDDDDQDLKDFFAHVQIENSSIIRTIFSRSLSVNTHPTTMFTLPSHRIIQSSSHAVNLINVSTTNRSKLFVSTTNSSFHQAKTNGASTVFIQQNNINTKFSKSNKNILIGDLFDTSEKITENLQQNKNEIKISDSVNNKNSAFSRNFVTSSIAVTSNDTDTSINFVTSSNSVTTQPAYYNEYNSQSNPTTNTQASTIVETNSDDLHHTNKNEQRTQNPMKLSKKPQHSFMRNNTNNNAAYSTKSYSNQKNHIVMNNTMILNNQVGKKNPFATLQPTLQTMQQQQTTTWQHITNPITDLLISNEAKSRDQITQILSDSETQDKKTNVGPGVIKFLQQTLLHIDENAKLAVKSTNSSVNTSPYTLDWICRNDVTDWSTAYIIGMSRFLQNHIITCKQNEFLQKFRLSDNKDNFFPLFRYEYVCCSLALVKT